MSQTEDRIPVPSNGHRPVSKRPPPAPAPAGVEAGVDDERAEPRIIVTPGQATAVGFGIIAALVLVLLGRRRGRRG
ncbi:MAG: hypothetical protein ACLGIJ_06785 [Candidatus Limnocylindria bacterium]